MRWLLSLVLFLAAFLGCNAPEGRTEPVSTQPPSTALRVGTKLALPISLAAAYFGSVATHEGGHALAGWCAGADRIKLTIIPGEADDGNFYYGYTQNYFKKRLPSSLEDSFINVSGPLTQQLAGHIFPRELLKTGYVPDALQPTLQWYAVISDGGTYGEILLGLFRRHNADLGKERPWVTYAFLAGTVGYDIFDFFFDDDPRRYMGVLVGESFYQPHDRRGILRLIVAPSRYGGFAGVIGDF